MDELQAEIDTLVADYERLRTNVAILHGYYIGMEELLIEFAPDKYHTMITAYADLLCRIDEDVENSYAVNRT